MKDNSIWCWLLVWVAFTVKKHLMSLLVLSLNDGFWLLIGKFQIKDSARTLCCVGRRLLSTSLQIFFVYFGRCCPRKR
jgi:hypothetical protein